ncbi:MAG: methyl-accepting chemotaxis protein [Betaproteobacteria bacterium]
MRSIKGQLNLVFISVVTLVLVISGALNYFSARSDLDAQLQEQADALSARLKLNVPTLLWNFDDRQIDKTLEAEMIEQDITGILVKNKDAIVTGRIRTAEGEIKPAEKGTSLSGKIQNLPLEYMDAGVAKPVGVVEFSISTARRDATLLNLVIKIIAQAVILNAILVLTLALSLREMVFRPLDRISHALQQIASGDADLTKRLDVGVRNEIGEVAFWFNTFVEHLQSIVGQVVKSTTGLGKAGDSMSNEVEQSAKRSEEQSEIISSMAAAMEEMTVGISHVSDQSLAVSDLSKRSGELAHGGNKAVNNLLVEMRRISDSVNISSETIETLGKESEKISTVVNVIKDIADQTNLLALNAAIEAARAGDMGRGFAVVADEVRKLAERTTKSTGEISSIIGIVQDGIRQSVENMCSGVSAVNSGLACADEAGKAIELLEESAGKVVISVNDISLAISEQTSASTEIARRVETIAQLADESNAAMNNTAESARTVKELLGSMQSVVSGFKV